MARGRKQQGEEKKSEVLSFRITSRQKELLNKNKKIKEELKKKVLSTLDKYKE